MQNKSHHTWRSNIIFALIVIMMAALFLSRALLSVSMIAFVTFSFFHTGIKRQLSHFISSPLLWGMSLLFFIPFLSGLWSEDKKEWAEIVLIKLPLLFLPLAVAGHPGSNCNQLQKKQWERLGYFFILLVTAATCWCMFHYVSNATVINESYLRAKSMLTPLENDHVRFSWLVCVGILLAGWLCSIKRKESKLFSCSLAIIAFWLIIFLHILAARTGLISFYIMATGTVGWLFFKKPGPIAVAGYYRLAILMVVIALPFVAYKVIPTFQNRVKYFLYDKEFFEKANYLPGSTDGVRIISLKAGWKLMQEQPLTGTGFGDILLNSKKWYGAYYPQMIEEDKILPSSEWMMYGAGCGWPGFILFSLVMLIPFFIKTSNNFLWWLLNSTAAFSFLFDIGLEVQFGVFIYAFIILWWWKWLEPFPRSALEKVTDG